MGARVGTADIQLGLLLKQKALRDQKSILLKTELATL